MATTLWIAVDIAAEGPDASGIIIAALEKNGEDITSWRIINPANPTDQEEFRRIGAELTAAFESTEVEGQMELPFEEGSD